MLEEAQALLSRLGFAPESVQRIVLQQDRYEVWVLEGTEASGSTTRNVLRVHRGFFPATP